MRDIEPPPDLAGLAAHLIRLHGAVGAARILGPGRSTVISIAARARVTRGTIAVMRERIRAVPELAALLEQLRADLPSEVAP